MAEASSVVTSAVDLISVSCRCGGLSGWGSPGLLSRHHSRPASHVRLVPLPDGDQVTGRCWERLAQH